MAEAVSNTSPILYLFRVDGLQWLDRLFDRIWVPVAVDEELRAGLAQGHHAPRLADYPFLQLTEPSSVPSDWLVRDLGTGEIAAMALALEKPSAIVLLDDLLARRIAQASGLQVWGTLRVVLTVKERGWIPAVRPVIDQLQEAGLWVSEEVKRRVLDLAGEAVTS